ncbi:hypothetical protein DEJ27_12215 [Curtobacterium sp. MCPF17_018]|uniref:LacI family DNA-binding transcriptional regulator n=1 Tax=Curtobacterium sp. MCPF17_018 TaxID=2175638 RepID=UPI000DA807D2|nr:LacI family DNA-binding transcriptional regulator [Curtobacterium sp. MCPF17_018]PZE67382.1 hypothetical protein DEJ27_12215 [Curtobacterium sp. MCPF17_018]
MSTSEVIRPATSIDVARLAGVSRTTVSRILRGDESAFPEATRRRVHEAAARLDYRPSSAGRSLVSGRSDTIVVLLPNSQFGSNLQEAVDEVAQQTRPYGGNVVVRFAGSDLAATMSAVQALRPLAVLDFGVLRPSEADRLRDSGLIVVPEIRPGTDTVSGDAGIGALQVEQLLAHGARDLWFVYLDDGRDDPYVAMRFQAIVLACREAGIPDPRRLDVGARIDDGVAALARIIAEKPVALACYNDDAALVMLAAARELKVDVPGSVAAIGVDAGLAGQLWRPRLTTIRVNMHRFVETVAHELADNLGGTWRPYERSWTDIASVVEGDTA